MKRDLDAAFPDGDSEVRLRHILRQIAALETAEHTSELLNCYVFIVSALVQHERHGGLPDSQVERLQELARSILQAQGLKPGVSRLASMYGDLHLIRGQIDRKSGRHWHAAWEQVRALRTSGPFPSGGDGFQKMALAARLLRLGHAEAAIAELDAILADESSRQQNASAAERPSWWMRGALLRVYAWRLHGGLEQAARLERELGDMTGTSANIAQEMAWEGLCRTAIETSDPRPLLRATRRHASHHEPSYILEAVLWVMSSDKIRWLDECPVVQSLARRKDLELKRYATLYKAVATLQEAYDTALPLQVRIDRVGNMLSECHEVLTVDKELLIWAAAARWLSRIKAATLAMLARQEYASLCLRLSSGRSDDVCRLWGSSIPPQRLA